MIKYIKKIHLREDCLRASSCSWIKQPLVFFQKNYFPSIRFHSVRFLIGTQFFLCSALVTRRNTSFSISLPSSKLTIPLILCHKWIIMFIDLPLHNGFYSLCCLKTMEIISIHSEAGSNTFCYDSVTYCVQNLSCLVVFERNLIVQSRVD